MIYNLPDLRAHGRNGRLPMLKDVVLAPTIAQDGLLDACLHADTELETLDPKLALETRSACAWARDHANQSGGVIVAMQDESDTQAVYYVQVDHA